MGGTSIWPHVSAPSLYKDSFCSSSTYKKTGPKTSGLFGRLACTSKFQSSVTGTSIDIPESSDGTRFHSKHKEVSACPYSVNNLHRRGIQSKARSCISNSREATKDFHLCSGNSEKGSSISFRIPSVTRFDGILHRTSSICKTSHETHSIASPVLLETKFQRYRGSYAMHTTFASLLGMVVTGSKHVSGQILSTLGGKQDHSDRCLTQGVGGLFTDQDSSRSLVSESNESTHKLFGNGSCSSDSETFSFRSIRSEGTSKIRQCDSGSVFEQTGRDKIPFSVLSSLGSMAARNQEQNFTESCSRSRSTEYIARPIESFSDQADRMDFEPECGSEAFLSVGVSKHRPVCVETQPQDSCVLFLDSLSGGFCNRCSEYLMGRNVCLCISSNLPSSKGSTTHETISMQTDSHRPILATSPLVSRVVANVSEGTSADTNISLASSTTQDPNIPSRSSSIQPHCMDVINKQFRAKGFSRNVTKLLTASWRSGTQKDYTSKFRKFSSWCSEREVDKYSASLVDCAEFLSSLFSEGLQYRTIAGYRSMLSAVLPPIGNVPVGQHPYIIRLLRGVFNSRPPIPRLIPEWDLHKVLKAIQRYPFEPLSKTSLKYVTLKTVFLTAITTFRRVGDLQTLRLGEGSVTVQSKGVTFLRYGLAKQDRPGHMSGKIFVPAFSQNKLLDPKRTLAIYLKRTEKFRDKKGKDETSLFLTINEPHGKASARTLASYIVKTIQEAYGDSLKKCKAHSTRAIGPSWALFNGASIKAIMDAADWSRESTFLRFYLRDINDQTKVLEDVDTK